MPFPEYSTREQWIEAARGAAQWAGNAVGIERFRIPRSDILSVIAAEASGADETGLSALSPEEVAVLSGAPLRTVRLIRAGLANSGLMSHTSPASPMMQLQLPRGTTRQASRS